MPYDLLRAALDAYGKASIIELAIKHSVEAQQIKAADRLAFKSAMGAVHLRLMLYFRAIKSGTEPEEAARFLLPDDPLLGPRSDEIKELGTMPDHYFISIEDASTQIDSLFQIVMTFWHDR